MMARTKVVVTIAAILVFVAGCLFFKYNPLSDTSMYFPIFATVVFFLTLISFFVAFLYLWQFAEFLWQLFLYRFWRRGRQRP